MFAVLGLGTQEIFLLLVLGVLLIGLPLVVVLIVTRMSGNRLIPDHSLEEENRRLRADLDRDRSPPP